MGAVTNIRFWAVLVAMIALFALVGPFGTFDRMPLLHRVLYWTSTMLGSWLIAMVVIAIVIGTVREGWLHPLVELFIGSVVASFLIAAWNLMIVTWTFPNSGDPFNYWRMLAYTLPITLLFAGIAYFVLKDVFEPQAAGTESRLLDRLPIAKRGVIKHMSMQDHYVSVTTSAGTELVLLRMADAVLEVGAENGLQVHRSHWVNLDYITDTKRDSGRLVLVMDDETEIPVSRTYAKAVREAGIR